METILLLFQSTGNSVIKEIEVMGDHEHLYSEET